jgi:hypothetical protein
MTYWQDWMACGLLMSLPAAAQADIFRWDNGQLVPGTQGITPGPGVNLSSQDLDGANLLTSPTWLVLYDNLVTSLENGDFQGLCNLRRAFPVWHKTWGRHSCLPEIAGRNARPMEL